MTSGGSTNNQRAFVYSGDVMTDLGTLGGTLNTANGINTSGQIIGVSETSAGFIHGVLFHIGSTNPTALGTLPGGQLSYANAINDAGQIVGHADIVGGNIHAVVYAPGRPRLI